MANAFNLTAQINLRGPNNIKPIIADIKKQLGTVTANVQLKVDPKASKSISTITKRLTDMNSVLSQARANADALSTTLQNLSNTLSSVNQNSNNLSNGVSGITESTRSSAKAIKQSANAMQEFGKQSALAVKRFAAFSIVTSGIYGLVNAVTSGFGAFIKFDKELVKLQQVTGKSAVGLQSLENEITRLSTTLGVSSESLLEVASTLAQAGLSAEETRTALEALAKTDLAPSFDNLADTTEGAIAAFRQFGLQASDLEAALGSINAVSAAFAVESADIIAAIQRTGGVFATASKGVSEGKDALNEFIAVFTSVRATTRESAETIATGLRTIFTRLQRASTINQLKEFGVILTDLEGKFVGPYEAVRRLSQALNQLDPRDIRFSKIVEELGGFRQIGKVIPLIQQFSEAQKALAVAQRGQGSLAQDAAIAQLSLANQIAKVREQFLALIRDIGKNTAFQSLATIVLTLTSGLINLAGAFKPLLPMLAIMGAIKGFQAATQFASGFAGTMGRGSARETGANVASTITGTKDRERNEAVSRAAEATKLNTTALNNLTTAVNNLSSRIAASGGPTFASGGKVKAFARGGVVPGSGNRDTVPAMLMPGEFVIRKKAVDTIGADNLHSMNKYGGGGSIRAGRSNKRQKFAKGGAAKIASIDGKQKAIDGDTFEAQVTPTDDPFTARFRISDFDTYETGNKDSRVSEAKAVKLMDLSKNKNKKPPIESGSGFKIPSNYYVTENLTASKAGEEAKNKLQDEVKSFQDTKKIKAGGGFGRYLAQGFSMDSDLTTGRKWNEKGVVEFAIGGKAESTPFGTGETKFPKRITNAYVKEIEKKLNDEKVNNTFNPYPSNERITIDPEAVSQKFQSEPFDRKRFLSLFNTKISRNELLGNLSDFAKFIGLPGDDLSKVLPQTIDFGGELQRSGNRGTFSRDPFSTQGYDNKGLEAFGFTQADEQDLFGYQKLLDEKTKEIKKILKTPIETFEDGSFSYDSLAFNKAMDEKSALGKKISDVMDKRAVARKGLMEQKKGVLASTGRGFVSMASNAFERNQPKNVLYHELTHQLFNSLRAKSEDSFTKYKERVSQLFGGDNDDLADAFDALGGSYNSADVVYGRSYKNGLLDNVLQDLRRGTISSGGRSPDPELAKEGYSMWVESGAKKNAREYRPINPKINEILLKGGQKQETIDKVEDYGKEEFLTTLIQNAPKLDSNMQGILDSTLNELLGNAGIQRQTYARGGKVTRNIGVIDTDILRDPTNTEKVKKAMEALGITDTSDYSIKLGELAAKARKKEELSKFIAIAGAAGSGKSSLAMGAGANDDATLRQTTRFPILTPEDIKKADQVIALTATASQSKLDAYLKDVDRAYILSSNTKEEQEMVQKGREVRDLTGAGLYGRKPGSTRGASRDFGVEEVTLREELGKKATVLGRKAGSYQLRRKKQSELSDIVQAGGYYTGGFAPATRGHAGAVETLLASMIEQNPNASMKDILVNAAGNLPMKSSEGPEHAARYGIFDADLRQLMARINFPGAMLAQGDSPTGEIPKYVEVLGSGDKRKFARTSGAMAITSGKDERTLGKYTRAGMKVTDIPRIEDISATKVREALFAGDDATLSKYLHPEIASILMGNRPQLQNRSTMVPMLLDSINKVVDIEEAKYDSQIQEILANAPGGPYKVLSKKLKENYPDIAEQVESLRKQKARLSEGALSYRAYNIISELSSRYPDMYSVDPNRRAQVSAASSDISSEIMAQQVQSAVQGAFGTSVPQEAQSGLQQAILQKVAKETAVKKSSGILPAEGREILKRFGTERLPTDASFGPFAGKTVRDTAEGGKLKYWNSAFRPETKPDKLAYYTATRDYLIDKFNESQGNKRTKTLEETANAVLSSQQLGLVGLNPLGYTGLLGPEIWNLGTDQSGQERSINASIIQRGLPTQYKSVIDYLSGETEKLVGGAAKLLGISPKKLSQKERETLGQGNIEGALLEQIFGSADAKILDDAQRTRPIDFPSGIGAKAAKIFGIDPDIPTEVKRTIDSGSRGKAVEEFQRYFRQQYGIPDPEKIAAFAEGGAVKLYHGSNTGIDDNVLKSFKEKGALSNIATGYGQGAGFYLYTEKSKAEQQAKMRVNGGSGFTLASGDRSGKPMVLSFDEVLDPKTFDLDYELQKGLVVQWIHDNYEVLKDKYAATENQTGLKGKFDKNPSAGMMSVGIRVQEGSQTLKSEDGTEFEVQGGARKSIYAGSEGDVREGALLGQLMSRIQSGDPDLVQQFESSLFKHPLGLALKYVGSSPLKPTNIETFATGGRAGISSKDTVPALLTPGEFVINKNAAQKIGYSKLHKLNKADKLQGYNKGGIVGGVQRFATGGDVDEYMAFNAEKAGQALEEFRRSIVYAAQDIARSIPRELRNSQTQLRAQLTEAAVGAKKLKTSDDRKNYVNDLANKLKSVSVDKTLDFDLMAKQLMSRFERAGSGDRVEDTIAAVNGLGDILNRTLTESEAQTEALKRVAEERGINPDLASQDLAQRLSDNLDSSFQRFVDNLGGPLKATTRALITLATVSATLRETLKTYGVQLSDQTTALMAGFEGFGKGAGVAGELDIRKNINNFADTLDGFFNNRLSGISNTLRNFSTSIQAGVIAFAAVSTAISEYYKSINESSLRKQLDNLSEASGKTAEAFKKLEQNASDANIASAQRILSQQESGMQDLRSRSMIDLPEANKSWMRALAPYSDMVSNAMGMPQEAEARKAYLAEEAINTGRYRQLGSQRLNRVKESEIQSDIDIANQYNTRLNQLDLERQAAKNRGDTTTVTARDQEIQRVSEDKANQLYKKSQTFATMRESGKSEQDIFRRIYLENASTDDQRERRRLAISGQLGSTDEEKSKNQQEAIAAAKQLLAVEAENERRQILLSRAYQKVALETESLIRTYDRASAMLKAFAQNIDKMKTKATATAAAYSGQATIGKVDRTNEEVLGNIQAYSLDQVKEVASQTAALAGGGVGGEDLKNQIIAAKIINDQLPNILAQTGSLNVDSAMEQLDEAFRLAGATLSDSVREELKGSLTAETQGKEGVSFEKFKSETNIVAELEKKSAAALKIGQEFQKQYNDALDVSIDLMNDYAKAMQESMDWTLKASDIRLNAEIALAEALGRNLTIAEKTAAGDARIRGLSSGVVAGGSTDPETIFNGMQSAIEERSAAEKELAKRQDALKAADGESPERRQELAAAVQEQLKVVADQNNAINNSRKALEELANDGTAAAAALKGLQEQQQAAKGSVNFMEKILTSDADELQKINKGLSAYTKVISGKATPQEMNSLEFRKNAFAGLNDISSMMPESLKNQMQAQVTRRMLESTPGGKQLLNTQTGALYRNPKTNKMEKMTFGQALNLAETGVDPVQDAMLQMYKEATDKQAKAAEMLSKAAVAAAKAYESGEGGSAEILSSLARDLPGILENAILAGFSNLPKQNNVGLPPQAEPQKTAFSDLDAAVREKQALDKQEAEKLGMTEAQFQSADIAYSNEEKAKAETLKLEENAAKNTVSSATTRVFKNVDEFRASPEYQDFKKSKAYKDAKAKEERAKETFDNTAIKTGKTPEELRSEIEEYRGSQEYRQAEQKVDKERENFRQSMFGDKENQDGVEQSKPSEAQMTGVVEDKSQEVLAQEAKVAEAKNASDAMWATIIAGLTSLGAAVGNELLDRGVSALTDSLLSIVGRGLGIGAAGTAVAGGAAAGGAAAAGGTAAGGTVAAGVTAAGAATAAAAVYGAYAAADTLKAFFELYNNWEGKMSEVESMLSENQTQSYLAQVGNNLLNIGNSIIGIGVEVGKLWEASNQAAQSAQQNAATESRLTEEAKKENIGTNYEGLNSIDRKNAKELADKQLQLETAKRIKSEGGTSEDLDRELGFSTGGDIDAFIKNREEQVQSIERSDKVPVTTGTPGWQGIAEEEARKDKAFNDAVKEARARAEENQARRKEEYANQKPKEVLPEQQDATSQAENAAIEAQMVASTENPVESQNIDAENSELTIINDLNNAFILLTQSVTNLATIIANIVASGFSKPETTIENGNVLPAENYPQDPSLQTQENNALVEAQTNREIDESAKELTGNTSVIPNTTTPTYGGVQQSSIYPNSVQPSQSLPVPAPRPTVPVSLPSAGANYGAESVGINTANSYGSTDQRLGEYTNTNSLITPPMALTPLGTPSPTQPGSKKTNTNNDPQNSSKGIIDNGTLVALDNFGKTIELFGQYVAVLSTVNIPSTIEIRGGQHVVDVRVSGAAAFQAIEGNMQRLITEQIDAAMDKLYNQTGGNVGYSSGSKGKPASKKTSPQAEE